MVLAVGANPAVAAAVPPPTVDPGRLPPNSAPVPPPTELRDPCTVTAPAADLAQTPTPQRALDLEAVWPLSTGRGQVVAVIDTGVERHSRLPGLIPGGDYVSSGDGTSDCDGHGTLVAGIIAATRSPETGFAGVAPDARILSIRQSSNIYREVGGRRDAEGQNARGVGNVGTLASAIRRAADLGATVVNISEVACIPAGSGDNPALGAAIDYASRVKDVVIVAAAGNLDSDTCRTSNPAPNPATPHANLWDSVTTIATPAWYDDQVLAVGSVNPDGSPSEFTLPGPWVDVAAPGTDITSLDPRRLQPSGVTDSTNGGPVQGTSFAAPYVAGTAALIRARYPELTARQVMDRIEATAHAPAAGWDPYVGHGVIDPFAAVTAAPGRAGPGTQSVELAIPAPAPPPDHRPRDVALAGAGGVAALLGLGLLASFPLRRRLQRAGGDTTIG
ncbi:type VII secretion-associated serine protease mycosin [Rhodococcus spelaei]|uniref:Type VII secretion-associated serine protease mycosin n=1 Tax=Rhodococcus spelaei TaxID=2546320 RepID=A0A541B9C4_9NOCA|nr:type VII secretion-associated serine protease mycosin [Rhodococcus spelaei]TQF68903.1 type VII secretion-associated serine protease mycosin [Rhodococcus spelaei]